MAVLLLRSFARFFSMPDVQEVAGGSAGTRDIGVSPWMVRRSPEKEKSSFVSAFKQHSSLKLPGILMKH